MTLYLLLIGPLPFLRFQQTKTLVYIWAALVGIGFGCVVVSTFARSYSATKKMGYKAGFIFGQSDTSLAPKIEICYPLLVVIICYIHE